MKKSIFDCNSEKFRGLADDFNLGMTKKSEIEAKEQAPSHETSDICLPPLLVEAFRSGLEDETHNCNCGCNGESGCSHESSNADHQGCGGCHHHG